MANKIVYPIVGGIIKNMKGDSGITAGMKVIVDADNTVDSTAGTLIHGIALDTPTVNSITSEYVVSVLLFGNCVIAVTDTMTGAVAGDYLKVGSGVLVKDGTAKTADSVALLIDAAAKIIVIL